MNRSPFNDQSRTLVVPVHEDNYNEIKAVKIKAVPPCSVRAKIGGAIGARDVKGILLVPTGKAKSLVALAAEHGYPRLTTENLARLAGAEKIAWEGRRPNTAAAWLALLLRHHLTDASNDMIADIIAARTRRTKANEPSLLGRLKTLDNVAGCVGNDEIDMAKKKADVDPNATRAEKTDVESVKKKARELLQCADVPSHAEIVDAAIGSELHVPPGAASSSYVVHMEKMRMPLVPRTPEEAKAWLPRVVGASIAKVYDRASSSWRWRAR